jgi:hypothetical protein
MAERRMFAKTIIDSDAFLDMPLSTQALYFHLSVRADDDGFVNNPKKIMRMIGAGEDELRVLLGKRFILGFDSGVIVIKHWRVHNYIQKDRYKPTVYTEEKRQITVKDNNVYTMDTASIQPVLLGKVRLGESRLDEVSQEDVSQEIIDDPLTDSANKLFDEPEAPKKKRKQRKQKDFVPPTLDEVKAYCKSRKNTVNPNTFFDYYNDNNWEDARGKKVKSWKQKMISVWEPKATETGYHAGEQIKATSTKLETIL